MPTLLHEGDQLVGKVAAMWGCQGGPLGQLAVLVTQRMQDLLHTNESTSSL